MSDEIIGVKLVDESGEEPVIQGIHGFESPERASRAVFVLLNMFAVENGQKIEIERSQQ